MKERIEKLQQKLENAVAILNMHSERERFVHLYIIIGLLRCVATRVAYVDGRMGDGRVAGTGGRRQAPTGCGRNTGLGLWRASQNRDVTPGAWLTRTDGRVQAIPPQSGMTACLYYNCICVVCWSCGCNNRSCPFPAQKQHSTYCSESEVCTLHLTCTVHFTCGSCWILADVTERKL